MGKLADEYLARDGGPYVPRRRRRSVSAFEGGWPNVGSKLTGDDTDVIAHGKLFGSMRGATHPFAYDDLETMRALTAYVYETPAVLDRLRPQGSDIAKAEVVKSVVDFAIQRLPASIFDRSKALNLTPGSAAVVDLYREREKSWLSPELAYQLVVPLVLTDLELEGTLEIDDSSRIETLGDDDLRAMASDYDVSGVPGPVADGARFAITIDMPPMKNPGETLRIFVRDEVPDTTRVDAICESLRIVSSVPTGWARVFRRPDGWATGWTDALPSYELLQTARRYPAAFDNYGWLKPGTTITRAELDRLPAVKVALAQASAPTRLAARRLSTAAVRDTPDDKLVDACIGLEALLGQNGSELSYRIALRAAALLSSRASDPLKAEPVFRLARAIYNRRSEIVHGSTSQKWATHQLVDGDPIATNRLAVWLLRQVLQERLLRSGNWQVEALDDLLLQRLDQA